MVFRAVLRATWRSGSMGIEYGCGDMPQHGGWKPRPRDFVYYLSVARDTASQGDTPWHKHKHKKHGARICP
ncbi:MAG: hypothetical protein ACYC3X_17820 [Pirellulaceae bacterium]